MLVGGPFGVIEFLLSTSWKWEICVQHSRLFLKLPASGWQRLSWCLFAHCKCFGWRIFFLFPGTIFKYIKSWPRSSSRHGGVQTIVHSRAGVSWSTSVSCVRWLPCPLAPLLARDHGQLLEGTVEEDGNVDNPPSDSLYTCTSQGSSQYAGRSHLNWL